MTIPTLINKTNNQEFVSRLKKAYSTLSQVTNKIIAENGSPKNWLLDKDSFYQIYKQYLSNAKECGAATRCLPQTYKKLDGTGGSNWDGRSSQHRRLVLADGMQIMFIYRSKDCDRDLDGSNSVCGQISVDINGSKGPNQVGRDYFEFAVKEWGLYPMGCDFDVCDKSGSGYGCACKVIRENAMNY